MAQQPGTTLNNVQPARDGAYIAGQGGLGTLRVNVTASQAKGVDVVHSAVLPANAEVTGGGVMIKTAFNNATPTLDIGVSGTSNCFASALALGVAGFQPLDDLALAPAAPNASDRSLASKLAGTSTIGDADIIIQYIVP